MRHVIFGGDGFVGRHLAPRLLADGNEVLVADIVKSDLAHYRDVHFVKTDVTSDIAVREVGLKPDDMVYNLSAKMPSPIQVRAKRRDFFFPVNYYGAENIMRAMDKAGASKLVHFTTDMVYGHTHTWPQTEDHPCAPLGEYGRSKYKTELLAADWRETGMNITLFRPRLIIGPGRLGGLAKLFKLIDLSLPVPMIGSGKTPCQFISVFDCASAALAAYRAGVPNEVYNLGSLNPPPIKKLLGDLIRHAGSKSLLVPTPGWAVKRTLDIFDLINKPIMDPEHYLVANEMSVLDVSKGERELNWVPHYRDEDMLIAAYTEYRKTFTGPDAAPIPQSKAA